MTTFEIVAKLVANAVGRAPEEITPETELQGDLDMDSLDAVELIMSLEEELGISIPSEATQELKTVAQIAALADSLRGQQ
ncbi:MAG: acyl carrier protein [Oscillospiraceae bacterium]|jgi:acyl carrier protein|nr:acyl carrier protein [Oscillospiraceae bacterium]